MMQLPNPGKARKAKPKRRPGQARRERPRGAQRVICAVIEKSSGRTVTQAGGQVSRKYSAESMARSNALRALKKKLGRHFTMDDYRLVFRID